MTTTCPSLSNKQRLFRTPICESLTRRELVGGLRAVFQRTRLDLVLAGDEPGNEHLQAVAAVLADVAAQFGLTLAEREDILAEYARHIEGGPR